MVGWGFLIARFRNKKKEEITERERAVLFHKAAMQTTQTTYDINRQHTKPQ